MKQLAALLALLGAASLHAQDAPPLQRQTTVVVEGASDPSAPLREARPTGRAADLGGVTFDVGGGRYAFASGKAWELAAAGGQVVGFYFRGSGKLTWKAEDPAGQKVYAENASRLGGLDTGADGALVAAFDEGTFYFSPPMRPAFLEALNAAEGGAPADAFKASRARFLADRVPAPEIGVAAAGADGRFFEALLEAGKDVRHRFDEVLDDDETLTVVEKPSGTPFGFPDWRFAQQVGRRPVAGQSRRAAPRINARLTEVSVDVRETEKNRGLFEVKQTWVAERAIRALALQLSSEQLTERTFHVMPTTITAITDEAGKPVSFAFERDRLALFFPAPLVPGRAMTLTFRYDAGYFERGGGDNYWELILGGGWYPEPLRPNAALHTWKATVRSKKPLVPFASGETLRRAEDGEWNLVETKLDRPVPFAMVIAGKYTIQEETRDGITCRVASYGVSKEKSGAKLLNLFHKIRQFYEPYFGPFPFKQYDIVEINTYGFGQAPPGMMRITREAFQANVYGDTVAELFSQGVNERFAHEIAHSYFGYVVWSADWADQWIDETFAEVAAGRAIEELRDKGEFKRLANVWRDRGREASGKAPIFYANELRAKPGSGSTIRTDRAYLVYFKGAMLLETIRKEVGEDAYFTILKSFLRSFEKKPAVTTEQFVGLLSYVTKKDWKPWFDRYYYGFENP